MMTWFSMVAVGGRQKRLDSGYNLKKVQDDKLI